ncbi:phage integrase Arm DNA-binding domain-containing protein [Citrobacter portucalensis]|uniref:phage integrase Arm DNA-binding domain-containing protein n=1 Tax=Citrobacter portucalensis TaxID=1639133 RepID=UPI00351D46C1
MARPRKYNVDIPGLYPYTNKKANKVYWRWRHPITEKFHGLGSDEHLAARLAAELNSRIAQQQMRQMLELREKTIQKIEGTSTVSAFLGHYQKLQQERYELGEIKLNTLKQKSAPIRVFEERFGSKKIDSITVKDIVSVLEEYKARGHNRMGQIFRKVIIDVFREAQQTGDVPSGFNPAESARKPQVKVSRQRLTFEEWVMIYNAAEKEGYFLQRGMLLALMTGQRLSDICKMKFSDISDGYLHIEQQKTGARIAIPLALRCHKLNLTLEDVVSSCRDYILSPWLLHHHHDKGKGKRGGMVKPATLTVAFKKARDSVDHNWSANGTPPSFHEQRSLSERLFREQGIDTRLLLGHSSQKMTDVYNNARGKEWKKLVI